MVILPIWASRKGLTDDAHLSSIDYRINRRPGSLAQVSDKAIDWERHIEFLKSLSANKQMWYNAHQGRWKKWRKRATSRGQYQMRSGRQ